MEIDGMIHVYTGDGKGKTTAALGLAMRAHGSGLSVLLVQFLKSAYTGEIESIKRLGDGIELMRGKSADKFIFQMSEEEKAACMKETCELFHEAINSIAKKEVDVLVLDEVFAAINTGMLNADEALSFLRAKPKELEVVMTGRDAGDAFTEAADYVMDIKSVKHPFDKGIPARKGVEF